MGAPLGSGIGYSDLTDRICPVCAAKDIEIDQLQALVNELAKAHASGGFVQLDADLAEQLAAKTKEA